MFVCFWGTAGLHLLLSSYRHVWVFSVSTPSSPPEPPQASCLLWEGLHNNSGFKNIVGGQRSEHRVWTWRLSVLRCCRCLTLSWAAGRPFRAVCLIIRSIFAPSVLQFFCLLLLKPQQFSLWVVFSRCCFSAKHVSLETGPIISKTTYQHITSPLWVTQLGLSWF